MRAGWMNIYISLQTSRRPLWGMNWWRVNGLSVVVSVAVWVLAVLLASML